MPERLGRVLAPKVTERKQADEVAKRLSGLPIRHVDWTLLAITFFLIGFGMLMQYSATRGDTEGNPTYYVLRTAISLLVGLIIMGLMLSFDYRRLKVATPFVYGAFLFFLVFFCLMLLQALPQLFSRVAKQFYLRTKPNIIGFVEQQQVHLALI